MSFLTGRVSVRTVNSGDIAADAVTNAKIADDAIDSEHYAAGSIDTAHIADDQITLAKMAAGTDGNLISFDTSGNPVAVAAGNDGQVLTSAGAGAVCLFEDASGGAWTLIGSQVASNSATLTQTGLTATYDTYCIVFSSLKPASDAQDIYFRIGDSGGLETGASDYNYSTWGNTPATTVAWQAGSDQSNSHIKLNNDISGRKAGNSTGEGFAAVIYLDMPGESTKQPTVHGTYAFSDQEGGLNGGAVSGHLDKDSYTLTQVQFLFSSGNVTSGRMTTFGIKHT